MSASHDAAGSQSSKEFRVGVDIVRCPMASIPARDCVNGGSHRGDVDDVLVRGVGEQRDRLEPRSVYPQVLDASVGAKLD